MRLTGPVQRLASALNRGRYERVMRLLGVTPRDRILELGCGDGRRSIARYNSTNEIVGIDLLPPARVRSERPNFHFEQGDASDLARFPDGAFDVAVSFGMLEHVHPESQIRAVISETRRVAGRYCFVVPHRYAFIEPHFLLPLFALWPDGLKSSLIRRFDVGTQRRNPGGRWQRINWLTKREWREQFDDPDVRILDHWYGPLLLDYLIVGEGGPSDRQPGRRDQQANGSTRVELRRTPRATRALTASIDRLARTRALVCQDQPLADDRLRP